MGIGMQGKFSYVACRALRTAYTTMQTRLRRAVRWSADIVASYLHWHGFITGSLSLQL